MLCKTVLSLKSPTGAFIAPLRCANANLSGQGPSILLAQDRSVTQKPHWGFCCFANVNLLCKQNSRQFPAFVCVHQPDGFKDLLTGDFCCRRLFVLPGSGLARSSPGIPCRRSCGFRGATGKTATKKPSQNRSALPSLFLEGHASRLC